MPAAALKHRIFAPVWLAGTTALLAVFALHAVWPFGGPGFDAFVGKWLNSAVCVLPGLYLVARAIADRRERIPWLVLGVAATLWGIGNTYFLVAYFDAETVPIPSIADGFWIAFYLFAYAGLVLLMRARIAGFRRSTWLDGLMGATAVASVATAIVFQAVLSSAGGTTLSVATNLSYPLADVLLIGLVVLVLTCSGWRPGRAWAILAAGFAVFAATDSIYLFQSAQGTYVAGKLLDVGWPLGLLLLGYASVSKPPRQARTQVGGVALLVPPMVFASSAIAVLAYDHFRPVTLLSIVLAVLCLIVVVARMAAAFLENLAMLGSSRREARTDALTGLANRRGLIEDLAETVGSTREPSLLVLFDLNGFKSYNDAFGHAAGDALLARLGEKLAVACAGLGRAYRMGGDEFCALVHPGAMNAGNVAATLGGALTEHGEGFAVSASYGAVLVPGEAADAQHALRLADHRMYAQKGAGRATEGQQAANALMRALIERSPELRDHLDDVTELAVAVGVALGLDGTELHHVRRAAQLHDIGKVAVPESILSKPGPLDDSEWEFIRRHTVVGHKILSAAPALSIAGELVRASHERFEGGGYPDGLAGDAIPLGARIIAVCDAFDAMTRDRPYRAAMSQDEALKELRRCSGGQFDPRVVAAFCTRIEGQHLRLAS